MLQDAFWAALHWTVEYQEWGRNARTLSAIMIALIAPFETWGIAEQARKIWKDKKTDCVSFDSFSYFFPFFFVCTIFGWSEHGAAMMFNAIITAIPQIWILVGFFKFKKDLTTRQLTTAALLLLMVPWMLYTPYKSETYTTFAFGLWWAFGSQAFELWREGKRGELSGFMVYVFFISSASWTTFAFWGDNNLFKLTQVGIIVAVGAITVLWTVYWWRDRKVGRMNLPLGKWCDQVLMR